MMTIDTNSTQDNFDHTLRAGDKCPKCDGTLVLKHVGHSMFLGCSNYPNCDFTYALEVQIYNVIYKILDKTCPECGGSLCIRGGKYGVFIGCSSYPKCNYIMNLHKKTTVHCPMCKDGILEQRRSRTNTTFYGCSNYPNCKFIVPGEPIAKTCPICGFPLVYKKKCKGGYKIACGNVLCSSRNKRKSLVID